MTMFERSDGFIVLAVAQPVCGHGAKPAGDSGSELAFLFYKDGIREITLLPAGHIFGSAMALPNRSNKSCQAGGKAQKGHDLGQFQAVS